MEAPGCPELGDSLGIDGVTTANEACCHCAGTTPAPASGATPTPAPVATPTNSPGDGGSSASHLKFSVAVSGLLYVILISLILN